MFQSLHSQNFSIQHLREIKACMQIRYTIDNDECYLSAFEWLAFVHGSSPTGSMDIFQVIKSYRNPMQHLNFPSTCKRKHQRPNKTNTLLEGTVIT